MVRGPRIARSAADRKLDKALANGHSGFGGQSIREKLEQQLTEACRQYSVLRAACQEYTAEDRKQPNSSGYAQARSDKQEARGRIRGLAMSVATLRHPLRVGDVAWWGYVKKLEARHVQLAKKEESDAQVP